MSTAIDCSNCDHSFTPLNDGDTYCEPCERAFSDGMIQGAKAERAAIVAWLRNRADAVDNCLHTAEAADEIERADQLRPDIKDGEGESK